ncbi:DUF7402 domain-containing protein [Actinomycetospora lemnae]|uniref:PIG-L family deacetylase n=1 Tax=Actinomycetospora lemnae TaxID=3019891 RepID=A0ABT5SVB4_9PSEU|nr:PIG-L family deacetylase [Actinomycetospora sp. DW7H6]MDD7966787.1 PIG-L family deacetylase [Actinomycetospora sp. DW7H6]
MRRRAPRAALYAVAGVGILVLALLGPLVGAARAVDCPAGSVVNVIAHPDDDLLFQSPDLIHDVQSERCVTTVVVTAGDANEGTAYWQSRESGARAAYAAMAGVDNAWSNGTTTVSGRSVATSSLAARSGLELVFLRLPDGGLDGAGGSRYGFQSLQKLYTGAISSIRAVNGSATYTQDQLVATLAALMETAGATDVKTLDYAGSYGDGDHSDHHTVGYLAEAAQERVAQQHTFTGYVGYPIASRPENVTGADLDAKTRIFTTYAAFDSKTCGSIAACAGRPEEKWWPRQYEVSDSTNPPENGNVAGLATANASSENTRDGQIAVRAVDGVVDGYPGDYTKEWASAGEGAGAWLELTWPTPVTIDRVVLHDRPNPADQVTGGTLSFSDGTTTTVGTLDNAGAATTVTFPARTVTSLRLTADDVSAGTLNIGLAEIEVR